MSKNNANGTIEFPDGKCIDGGHFYINLAREIWWCRKCWKSKWLPADINTASDFGFQVRFRGIEAAYRTVLDHNPSVVRALQNLEDLRSIRSHLPDQALQGTALGKLLKVAVDGEPVIRPNPNHKNRIRIKLDASWLEIEILYIGGLSNGC